jgi:hypothetical protein
VFSYGSCGFKVTNGGGEISCDCVELIVFSYGSCGFKVTNGGGEISCDCVELIVFNFHYPNKKYEGGSTTFHPFVFIFRYYRILKSSRTVRPVTIFSFGVIA